VSLSLSPPGGVIDLRVVADASASHTYAGGPISSFRFDFGDGTLGDPQTSPIANHVYPLPGTYLVTVFATDRLTASISRIVIVTDDPPSIVLSLSPSPKSSLLVTADASGSTDDDATPIVSYRFDFGDGTVVGPQPSPIATHKYGSRGMFRVSVSVTDSAGLTATATALIDTKDGVSTLRFAAGRSSHSCTPG